MSYRTREIAQCLQRLTRAGHSVASRAESVERQEAILEALLGVLENSEEVLVAAKTMLESTDVS